MKTYWKTIEEATDYAKKNKLEEVTHKANRRGRKYKSTDTWEKNLERMGAFEFRHIKYLLDQEDVHILHKTINAFTPGQAERILIADVIARGGINLSFERANAYPDWKDHPFDSDCKIESDYYGAIVNHSLAFQRGLIPEGFADEITGCVNLAGHIPEDYKYEAIGAWRWVKDKPKSFLEDCK